MLRLTSTSFTIWCSEVICIHVMVTVIDAVLKLIREEHGRLLKGMEDDDLPAEFDQTLSVSVTR